jgi:hypothetical protein
VYHLSKETAVRVGAGGLGLHFETLNGDVTLSRHERLLPSRMNLSFLAVPTFCMRQLVLAFLVGGTLPALAQEAASKAQLTVTLTAPDKPGSLTVALVSGAIHVRGYSGKSILVSAVARPRPASEERADKSPPPGMKRLSNPNAPTLTAEEKNNHIDLETDSHRHPIDLTIQVPLNFSLNLETVRDGNIVVENVRGELEISNVDGAITLKQVGGSAVANTLHGNLTATFTSVTAGTPMAFSSLTGKVDVTFPTSTKASIKLKSERGQLYSDFDIALSKRPSKATTQGSTHFSVEEWSYGALNGGGAEIMLSSLKGDIFLRKAK